jgi:pyrrolidone-carboxylate peptidase
MLITNKLVSCIVITLYTFSLNAHSTTVEEQRIIKADKVIPSVSSALLERVNLFSEQVKKANNLTVLSQLSIRHGKGIWNDAKSNFKNTNDFDDRPLYWSRLKMSKVLKQTKAYKESLPDQQDKLIWQFELYSRGQTDIKFDKSTTKKILVVGFDPFLLDRNIKQSNPSGVSAIVLDDLVISAERQSAEIETLILPVRFEDFDQGIVEELLTPYFRRNAVDMILTLNMGRNEFILERFSGLRRSSLLPDNLNVTTGASKDNPLIPLLGNKPLKGSEFLEFTLPADEMRTAEGFFPIKDNRIVSSKNNMIEVVALAELVNDVSVKGSGGGYLSNELSYRSLLLRDLYNPLLPVGHMHIPSFKGYDAKKTQLILSQLKRILTKAVKTL